MILLPTSGRTSQYMSSSLAPWPWPFNQHFRRGCHKKHHAWGAIIHSLSRGWWHDPHLSNRPIKITACHVLSMYVWPCFFNISIYSLYGSFTEHIFDRSEQWMRDINDNNTTTTYQYNMSSFLNYTYQFYITILVCPSLELSKSEVSN